MSYSVNLYAILTTTFIIKINGFTFKRRCNSYVPLSQLENIVIRIRTKATVPIVMRIETPKTTV